MLRIDCEDVVDFESDWNVKREKGFCEYGIIEVKWERILLGKKIKRWSVYWEKWRFGWGTKDLIV